MILYMAGAFWNGRGLGDDRKKRFLINAISHHRLDFVCVQETKKEEDIRDDCEIAVG